MQDFINHPKFTAEDSARLIPTYSEQIRVLQGEKVTAGNSTLTEKLRELRELMHGSSEDGGSDAQPSDEASPLPVQPMDNDLGFPNEAPSPSMKHQKLCLGLPPRSGQRMGGTKPSPHDEPVHCKCDHLWTRPPPSLEAVRLFCALTKRCCTQSPSCNSTSA